jgi:hypothetical protein
MFGGKPLPLMVVVVPGTPEDGLNDIPTEGTVKLADVSIAPPAGISART